LRHALVGRGARRRALDPESLATLVVGGAPLRLDAATDLGGSAVTGWSFGEVDGRWTVGPEAVLAVRLDGRPSGDLPVTIDTEALVRPDNPRCDVEVWAGDEHVTTWTF